MNKTRHLSIALALIVILAAVIVHSDPSPGRKKPITRPKPRPIAPYKPVPRPKPIPPMRVRRDNGQLHAHSTIVRGRPVSNNIDYEKKIYQNNHGHVTLGGGLQHTPHQKLGKNVGVSGSFDFGGHGRSTSADERQLNAIMAERRRHQI